MASPLRQKLIDRIAARFAAVKPAHVLARLNRKETRQAIVTGLLAGSTVFATAAGIHMIGQKLRVHDDRTYAEASAPLTTGESTIVHAVFGQDFRTDNITKYFHRGLPTFTRDDAQGGLHTAAYVRLGNTTDIHFVERDRQAQDYSRIPDHGNRLGTFMHEMTHIWQHRNGQVTDCNVYDYTLSASSHFNRFCNEQQGNIISDYVQRFLQPDSESAYFSRTNYGERYSAYDTQLARVVEEQFPQARLARETMQQRFNIAGACLDQRADMARMTRMRLNMQMTWQACAARYVQTLDNQSLSGDAGRAVLAKTPPRQRLADGMRVFWAKTFG